MQIWDTKHTSQNQVQQWREQGLKVGFVPTMGHLHDGHLSLLKHARQHADKIVASIYVNPTQFAANEDFETYPRSNDADIDILKRSGWCDAVYMPKAMYSPTHATMVVPEGVAYDYEAAARPHFFAGVATIVLKLFQHVPAHLAVFGQKDFQQLQVIRHMVDDLDLDISIMDSPTIREDTGLALSSRNSYLSTEQRKTAPLLFHTLQNMKSDIANGHNIQTCLNKAETELHRYGFDIVDYLAYCDMNTLRPLSCYQPRSILLAAARLGDIRLIDNLIL